MRPLGPPEGPHQMPLRKTALFFSLMADVLMNHRVVWADRRYKDTAAAGSAPERLAPFLPCALISDAHVAQSAVTQVSQLAALTSPRTPQSECVGDPRDSLGACLPVR